MILQVVIVATYLFICKRGLLASSADKNSTVILFLPTLFMPCVEILDTLCIEIDQKIDLAPFEK